MFANGPRDLGSIPGRVIPKTQKMVLDSSLLNTQHYKVQIKGKFEQSREGVAPSPTPWCSSYRKGEPSGHPRLSSPTFFLFKKEFLRTIQSNKDSLNRFICLTINGYFTLPISLELEPHHLFVSYPRHHLLAGYSQYILGLTDRDILLSDRRPE